MNNKRCAIIIQDKLDNFDLSKYDLLIGVEKGSAFVIEAEKDIETKHISDFDSIDSTLKAKLEMRDNVILKDHEKKMWADGEEAIILATELGYEGDKIDVYVDTTGREDHFINMVMILRKYGCSMIGPHSKFITLKPMIETTIFKEDYDYLSLTFFKQTKAKTEGLKWEIARSYDIASGTNCISNVIINDHCKIHVDQKTLLILTKEK